MIERGEKVSLHQHLKDIMEHYEVVKLPLDIIEGCEIPKNGSFY